MRVLHVTHELVRVLGLHLEEPDAVVSAGRGDEAALVTPVDVVGTPLVVAAQGRDALPRGIISTCADALLVPRLELAPYLQSEILADGRDPRSGRVEGQAPDGRLVRIERRKANPVIIIFLEIEIRNQKSQNIKCWFPSLYRHCLQITIIINNKTKEVLELHLEAIPFATT